MGNYASKENGDAFNIDSFMKPTSRNSPTTILPNEILLQIFAYLDKPDLARCLRVSRRFFDLTGRMLYSGNLVFDPMELRRTYWGKQQSDILICERLDILEGLYVSFWDRWFQWTSPSPLKLALLRYTRSVDYHIHTHCDCSDLPKFNFLPGLEALNIVLTLTVLEDFPDPQPVFWQCSSLKVIRPRTVSILDLPPSPLAIPHFAPLQSMYGSSVEEVQIQATHFLIRDGRFSEYPGITVQWPASLKRLCIVYNCPIPFDPLTMLAHRSYFNSGSSGEQVTRGILNLLSEVETMRPDINIIIELKISLKSKKGKRQGKSAAVSGQMSIKAVREGYSDLLESEGASAKDKAKRMEALVVEARLRD